MAVRPHQRGQPSARGAADDGSPDWPAPARLGQQPGKGCHGPRPPPMCSGRPLKSYEAIANPADCQASVQSLNLRRTVDDRKPASSRPTDRFAPRPRAGKNSASHSLTTARSTSITAQSANSSTGRSHRRSAVVLLACPCSRIFVPTSQVGWSFILAADHQVEPPPPVRDGIGPSDSE